MTASRCLTAIVLLAALLWLSPNTVAAAAVRMNFANDVVPVFTNQKQLKRIGK